MSLVCSVPSGFYPPPNPSYCCSTPGGQNSLKPFIPSFYPKAEAAPVPSQTPKAAGMCCAFPHLQHTFPAPAFPAGTGSRGCGAAAAPGGGTHPLAEIPAINPWPEPPVAHPAPEGAHKGLLQFPPCRQVGIGSFVPLQTLFKFQEVTCDLRPVPRELPQGL